MLNKDSTSPPIEMGFSTTIDLKLLLTEFKSLYFYFPAFLRVGCLFSCGVLKWFRS